MAQVTVTRKSTEAAVPSLGGVGGFTLQDAVSVVTTHTGGEITVIGTRSYMGDFEVTEDAPKGDHEQIVSFWQAEAERWSTDPESDPPAPAASVLWNGGLLEAPGFTTESFQQALGRATSRGFYSIAPAGNGAVIVTTESGTPYQVTRQDCTCQGHLGHGACQHRAAAIAVADLWGLPICQVEVIGFEADGRPVLADEQLQEVA